MENKRELALLIDSISKEHKLDKNDILTFLEDAMIISFRKNFPEGSNIQIEIDETHNKINGWRIYKLVNQIENPEQQMLFNEVEDEEIFEDCAWEFFEPKLTRQQFNIIKQITLQKIKNKSKEKQIELMLERKIKIYQGTIKFINQKNLIIEYLGIDIIFPKKNMLPHETFKINQKITFTLEKINDEWLGTRNSKEFVIELLKEEVPQINDGDIEIIACSRIPGFKTKILVKSQKYEAARTCIGWKGINIKNVQKSILGESIDIIQYDINPINILIKSLEPALLTHIVMNEDLKLIEVAVDNNDLLRCLGKENKNIELISTILGWKILVYSDDQWIQKEKTNKLSFIQFFIFALNCDEFVAEYIFNLGYTSLEELAYLEKEELELEELDDDSINSLQKNAKSTLCSKDKNNKAQAILFLFSFGFDTKEVFTLINNKIYSQQDIADLSYFELQEILPNIDIYKAKDMIIKSRQLTKETL